MLLALFKTVLHIRKFIILQLIRPCMRCVANRDVSNNLCGKYHVTNTINTFIWKYANCRHWLCTYFVVISFVVHVIM